MATDAVELATAYVSLVPSMDGAQGNIATQLVPAAVGAGTTAGQRSGGTFHRAFMRYAAPAAIGAGIVAGFRGLWGIGSMFDDMSDTIAISSGASGEALDGLVESARNVGTTIPVEFGVAGDAIATLNTHTDATGDGLEAMTESVLEASRMLGEDASANADTFGRTMRQWQVDVEDAPGIMDSLFVATQDYGVSLSGLMGHLNNYGPVLQNAGFTMEESAALFGQLEQGGISVSRVMPGLNKSFRDWAAEGKDVQAELATVVDTIADAETGTEALAIATDVFGAEGAQRMTTAIRSGSFELGELSTALADSEGAIATTAEETASFGERWQVVKNQAADALEPFAVGVFDGLSDALTFVMPYLESLSSWLGDNTWAIGAFAAVIGTTLTVAFFAWTASVWASTTALLANPMTWIVVGIMALIAALVLLIANWDTVVEFLQDVWSGIVDWLAGIWESITDGISTAWNAIADFFSGLWDTITEGFSDAWNGITDFLSGIWDTVTDVAQNAWNSLVDWITGIPGRFLDGLRNIGNLASDMAAWVGGIYNSAVDKFLDLVDWVRGIPGRILDALGNLGTLLFDAGWDIIQGFLDGLRAMWDNVTGFIGGIGSWIANNKGPKQYDLNLLVPAGGWIMTGLRDGLEDEIPALERTMNDITGTIRAGVPDRVALTGTGGVSNVSVASSAAAGRGQTFQIYETSDPRSTAAEVARRMALAGG